MKSLNGGLRPSAFVALMTCGFSGSEMSKIAVPPAPACRPSPAPSTAQWWPAGPPNSGGLAAAAGEITVDTCFGFVRSDRSMIENFEPASPALYAIEQDAFMHAPVWVLVEIGRAS